MRVLPPKRWKLLEGKTLTVRQWQDMADKYGITPEGSIITPENTYFISAMRKYCGKKVTVDSIHDCLSIEIMEDNGQWFWSLHMFEETYKWIDAKWEEVVWFYRKIGLDRTLQLIQTYVSNKDIPDMDQIKYYLKHHYEICDEWRCMLKAIYFMKKDYEFRGVKCLRHGAEERKL